MVALLMLLFGFKHQAKMADVMKKRIPGKKPLIPKAVHVLIITTQLYELMLVIEHASLPTIAGALLLLAILVASKTGTEDHLA